ncbi:MAG: ABC transporter substrate-binding protein [bacterium]|nr:ABC transporter substrate-binding protein [bacterium]
MNIFDQIKKKILALAVGVLVLSGSEGCAENILIIKSQELPQYESALNGFKKSMKSSGYIENKNVVITYATMDTLPDNFLAYDLIYTIGTEAAKTAKDRISNIPIVFSMILDPVKNKILNNAADPEGNITGVAIDLPVKQQLELISGIMPGTKNVGVVFDPSSSQAVVNKAIKEASAFGLNILTAQVSSSLDVAKAIKSILDKISVLWLIIDPTVATKDTLPFILNQCRQNNVAVFGFAPFLVKVGAIASPVLDYEDIGEQAGNLAAEILSKKSQDLPPVAYPRKFSIAFNTTVASALGVKMSSSMNKRVVESYN